MPDTRERLLTAAADLFYAEGITAVGVDRVCQRAGVSKRSLYALFGTKDDLVAASLERHGARLTSAYFPGQAASAGPRDRILHVFGWLESASRESGFEGCPFVAAATELKDATHPGAVVARRYKDRLTSFFEREAAALGAADPAELAQQLTVVFDGCSTRVTVAGHRLDGLATRMATALLDSAGTSPLTLER